MRRKPIKNRVQNSRSSFSNPRLYDPKLREMGGATERHKLKKYVKNQKCKQRCANNKKLSKPTSEGSKPLSTIVEENEAASEENDAVSEETKSAEKVYKKLLPKKSNGTPIVQRMAESTMMSKCFAEKIFPSRSLKFS